MMASAWRAGVGRTGGMASLVIHGCRRPVADPPIELTASSAHHGPILANSPVRPRFGPGPRLHTRHHLSPASLTRRCPCRRPWIGVDAADVLAPDPWLDQPLRRARLAPVAQGSRVSTVAPCRVTGRARPRPRVRRPPAGSSHGRRDAVLDDDAADGGLGAVHPSGARQGKRGP